jgi:hypothetical protein
VLLDAPCSGDGTIRKEPSIWKSWQLRDGLQLHHTQLRLLVRGLTVLKARYSSLLSSQDPLATNRLLVRGLTVLKAHSAHHAFCRCTDDVTAPGTDSPTKGMVLGFQVEFMSHRCRQEDGSSTLPLTLNSAIAPLQAGGRLVYSATNPELCHRTTAGRRTARLLYLLNESDRE